MRWARRAASWRRAREGGMERGGGIGAVAEEVVVLVGDVDSVFESETRVDLLVVAVVGKSLVVVVAVVVVGKSCWERGVS